jgi:hypothetical protein
MKLTLIAFLAITLTLVSCEPALYMSIENHTGTDASILFNFEEDNALFKVKAGNAKQYDLSGTAIDASVEVSFSGGGSWDDATIDKLMVGMNRIIIRAKTTTIIIEDKAEIRSFFETRIIGSSRNGIKILIS